MNTARPLQSREDQSVPSLTPGFYGKDGFRSFSAIFKQYYVQIRRQMLPYVRWNYTDADDIAANTFLKMFQSQHTFVSGSDLAGWLYTIARNTTLDFQARKREFPCEGLEHYIDSEASSPQQSSMDQAYGEECRKIIERKVPIRFRDSLLQYVFEGKEYQEIAALSHQPIGTVMSRISRARSYLRPHKQEFLELLK